MVMHTFSLDGRSNSLGGFGAVCGGGVPELLGFGIQSCFDLVGLCMLKFLGLHGCHLVTVLLWKDLAIFDRLNGGVVMILVNVSFHRCLDFFMSDRLNLLMYDGCTLSLINGGVVMTSSPDELGNGSFGFLHCH
jgi:hypothetical protein